MKTIGNSMVKTLAMAVILFNVRAEAGVALGATRIVYPAEQKQVTLGVSNSNDKDTFLIHSWVENEDGKKESLFVITPPLLLMQGKKENTLRIIDATNNSLPEDKESIFWVNVKAIPSLDKEKKKENTLQLSITSRIKLFYRPQKLSMPPDQAPDKLTFTRHAHSLVINNPTPYFLTIAELNAGTHALANVMVPPLGYATVKLPEDAGRRISYRTINDYGALTPFMKKNLQ